ncbi:hypothetical protein C8046_00195 [Serinibacter arcticus]|uniref:Large ribosomal subunit protein bL12 C-terminal domain-containing protein n=1 Tax=Serinibacter arcticus TaxID=1655435 RepID=A0A2U1ZZ39_9MICO|nr:hypothetical protein C8046_00195 [Serinibacter arcticus]
MAARPAGGGSADATDAPAWGSAVAGYQPSERVYTALLAGRKIEAIKIVREETSWGLAEAKNFVDRFERTL